MASIRPLLLDRQQILGHRRRVGALDVRLPHGRESLRRAAWAGLQDSMPRAALLSLHARIEGIGPAALDDPALVQVWGPRFSAYVVASEDLAIFTIGRLVGDARSQRRADALADELEAFLAGRRMGYGEAGNALGVVANRLRYAAPSGRLVMRWDGARQPVIWMVPPPAIDLRDAGLELGRRYLHVFGPTTPEGFATWAGISASQGRSVFESLAATLVPVRSPVGGGWILASDERSFRTPKDAAAAARLLPSGDPYFLLQGDDRALLVPEPDRGRLLWTSRVWPGAVIVAGDVVGTWRRAGADVTVQTWRPLSRAERRSLEEEAVSFPLPDVRAQIRITWTA